MRLRTRTGFDIQTALPEETLVAQMQVAADRFKSDHEVISDIRVETAGPGKINVNIVMATPDYATADQVVEALADDLRSELKRASSPVSIEARETELVPA